MKCSLNISRHLISTNVLKRKGYVQKDVTNTFFFWYILNIELSFTHRITYPWKSTNQVVCLCFQVDIMAAKDYRHTLSLINNHLLVS